MASESINATVQKHINCDDRTHQLTMLYLSNKDLSKETPLDVAVRYREAYKEIFDNLTPHA